MTTTTTPVRYGMTVPFAGPLHAQADRFRELADLGYTDAWTAEADAHDGLRVRLLLPRPPPVGSSWASAHRRT